MAMVGVAPVPMHAGGERDHVTRANLFDGSAFALSPAAASRHDQGLPERMSMPSRVSAPGSKVTLAALALAGSGLWNSGRYGLSP